MVSHMAFDLDLCHTVLVEESIYELKSQTI